jgi:hypothetical protein
MGVEIIQCPMSPEFDAAVFEKIQQGFSFLDEDEPLPVLDHHPHNTNKPDSMGENPLRWCLHPANAFSFR